VQAKVMGTMVGTHWELDEHTENLMGEQIVKYNKNSSAGKGNGNNGGNTVGT
jgi:hypothetical protein